MAAILELPPLWKILKFFEWAHSFYYSAEKTVPTCQISCFYTTLNTLVKKVQKSAQLLVAIYVRLVPFLQRSRPPVIEMQDVLLKSLLSLVVTCDRSAPRGRPRVFQL